MSRTLVDSGITYLKKIPEDWKIYRIKDGAYIGTFYVNFGELESAVVVDGYLVLLINITGTSTDYVYKSKSKVPLP